MDGVLELRGVSLGEGTCLGMGFSSKVCPGGVVLARGVSEGGALDLGLGLGSG